MTFRRIATALAGIALTAVTACGTANPGSGQDAWPAGRTFLSTEITEAGAPKPLIEGTRIELRFDEDGRVSAKAGCNQMSGTGRVESNALVISDLETTDMGCPDGRDAQDSWIVQFLADKPTLRIDGATLTLTTDTVTIALTDRQ